jgi:hypothetical protein
VVWRQSHPQHSSTTSRTRLADTSLEPVGRAGGHMLFKLALVLLAAWLIGVLAAPNAGSLVHVLLLAGLALLLLAFLRARDEAMRRAADRQTEKS